MQARGCIATQRAAKPTTRRRRAGRARCAGRGAQAEVRRGVGLWARRQACAGCWGAGRAGVGRACVLARCDTVGPGHDTAGPRPATQPLGRHDTMPVHVPGRACARRLDQVGALCTWLSSDSVFEPVFDSVLFLSH